MRSVLVWGCVLVVVWIGIITFSSSDRFDVGLKKARMRSIPAASKEDVTNQTTAVENTNGVITVKVGIDVSFKSAKKQ